MKNGQVGAFISSQSWVHCSSHLPSHIQLGTQVSSSYRQNSSSQHPPLHSYSLAFLQNVIAFCPETGIDALGSLTSCSLPFLSPPSHQQPATSYMHQWWRENSFFRGCQGGRQQTRKQIKEIIAGNAQWSPREINGDWEDSSKSSSYAFSLLVKILAFSVSGKNLIGVHHACRSLCSFPISPSAATPHVWIFPCHVSLVPHRSHTQPPLASEAPPQSFWKSVWRKGPKESLRASEDQQWSSTAMQNQKGRPPGRSGDSHCCKGESRYFFLICHLLPHTLSFF